MMRSGKAVFAYMGTGIAPGKGVLAERFCGEGR